MATIGTVSESATIEAGERRFERLRVGWPAAEFLLLALFATLVGVGGVRAGWKHLNSDFPNYYTAAKLYRQSVPLDRAYEWTWFQREAIREGVTEQPLV